MCIRDSRFSHAIWTDDPEWLERQFHLLFASWHYAMPTGSGTEWFELSWPHIRWARQIEAINSDYMRSFIENRDHILELNMAYAPALLSGMGRFNG